jgi:hypothetical protein
MVLVLFGPSCSGKSAAALRISQLTGAKVWSGRDYFRLAKNEDQAWAKLLELLAAAAAGSTWSESIVYVAGDVGLARCVLGAVPDAIPVRLHADLPTLESRFAPRTGGTVSPGISRMLRRSLEATAEVPSIMTFDTARVSCSEVAGKIIEWCDKGPIERIEPDQRNGMVAPDEAGRRGHDGD